MAVEAAEPAGRAHFRRRSITQDFISSEDFSDFESFTYWIILHVVNIDLSFALLEMFSELNLNPSETGCTWSSWRVHASMK